MFSLINYFKILQKTETSVKEKKNVFPRKQLPSFIYKRGDKIEEFVYLIEISKVTFVKNNDSLVSYLLYFLTKFKIDTQTWH